MTPTTWLVKDFVPLRAITLLAGDGGCGKGTIMIDLAARITRGEPAWGLDYEPPPPSEVIMVGCEDSISSTVVPLLAAAGADLSKIHILEGVGGVPGGDNKGVPFTFEDLASLDAELARTPAVRLIVIDPVSAFLQPGVDDCQDASVRIVIRPLAELAERRNVSVGLVRHLNKSESGNGGNLVGGSRAWVNASRAAFLAGPDPTEEGKADDRRRVLVYTKANLSPRTRGIAYRIEGATLAEQDAILAMPKCAKLDAEAARNLRGQLRRVKWLGETDATQEDVARARRGSGGERGPKKAEECAAWLRAFLGKSGWPDKEVEAAAKGAGFSFQAYRDAKYALKAEGLQSRPRSGAGHPAPWWIGFGPESGRADRPLSGVSCVDVPPDSDSNADGVSGGVSGGPTPSHPTTPDSKRADPVSSPSAFAGEAFEL
jgi:hypothetical protein